MALADFFRRRPTAGAVILAANNRSLRVRLEQATDEIVELGQELEDRKVDMTSALERIAELEQDLANERGV